jgi:hypothetical protein
MDGQKGYLNFIDMINGGGMGAAGDKFEGGGLLSMLGNALGIAPYGSRERQEAAQKALAEGAASMSAGGKFKPTAMMSSEDVAMAQPVSRAADMSTAGMSPLEMFGGQQPAPYEPVTQVSNGVGPAAADAMLAPGYSDSFREPMVNGLLSNQPADPMYGADPGRINEFARWMVDNYGMSVENLPTQAAQDMYKRWMTSRTGYRM